jgi:hypothetical protein
MTFPLCFEFCEEAVKARQVTGRLVQGACDEPVAAGTEFEITQLDTGVSQSVRVGSRGEWAAALPEGRHMIVYTGPVGSGDAQRLHKTIQVADRDMDAGAMNVAPAKTLQKETHKISGFLKDARGNAVPNHPVVLLDADTGRQLQQATSGPDGGYSLYSEKGSHVRVKAGKPQQPPVAHNVTK